MDQMSAGKTPGEESSPAERQEQRSNSAAATTAGDGGEHESEEAERQRIERLGRERPPKLKSFEGSYSSVTPLSLRNSWP